MADLFSGVNQYAMAMWRCTPLFDKAPVKGARVELAELPIAGHFNLRVDPANADATNSSTAGRRVAHATAQQR